jgi:excisionase family DNA binding protein
MIPTEALVGIFSPMNPKLLITAEDVAKILGLSPKTVHKLVREGRLGCVQVTSKERRFTEEQVELYVASQTIHRPIDKITPPSLSCPRKGGAKSSGVLSRQALLEEMRKCR